MQGIVLSSKLLNERRSRSAGDVTDEERISTCGVSGSGNVSVRHGAQAFQPVRNRSWAQTSSVATASKRYRESVLQTEGFPIVGLMRWRRSFGKVGPSSSSSSKMRSWSSCSYCAPNWICSNMRFRHSRLSVKSCSACSPSITCPASPVNFPRRPEEAVWKNDPLSRHEMTLCGNYLWFYTFQARYPMVSEKTSLENQQNWFSKPRYRAA